MWRRDPVRFVQVDEQLMFGRLPDDALVAELQRLGVRKVIDLTAEHSASRRARDLDYTCVPMMDLAPPPAAAVCAAVEQIERARAVGAGVYLHCGIGYGRSAVVAARWLLDTGRVATVREAAQRVAAQRPTGLSAERLERCVSAVEEVG
jgi:protein-tyrosine phosphatase